MPWRAIFLRRPPHSPRPLTCMKSAKLPPSAYIPTTTIHFLLSSKSPDRRLSRDLRTILVLSQAGQLLLFSRLHLLSDSVSLRMLIHLSRTHVDRRNRRLRRVWYLRSSISTLRRQNMKSTLYRFTSDQPRAQPRAQEVQDPQHPLALYLSSNAPVATQTQ